MEDYGVLISMRFKHIIWAIALLFLTTGCYATITGTVIDAETGKPIEGTVVLAQWTATKGFGLTYHERYKVIETVTDKEGKFIVSGVLNPFVDPPEVVIYKEGYVAWRNDFIFPDYKKREDFKWKNNYIFKLKPFKKGYSHSQHISFISTALRLDASSKLDQAYSWELPWARKEEELYRKKLKEVKTSDNKNEGIWEEIIEELYFKKDGGPHE